MTVPRLRHSLSCCILVLICWILPASFGFSIRRQGLQNQRPRSIRLYGEYEEYMAQRRAQEAKQQEGQPPFPDLSSSSAPPSTFDSTIPSHDDSKNTNESNKPPPKKNYSPGGGIASWKTSSSSSSKPPAEIEAPPTTADTTTAPPSPAAPPQQQQEAAPPTIQPRKKEWMRSKSSTDDDAETARLKQIMMEARQRVQQSRQQQQQQEENAWWKQEAMPLQNEDISLDPPSMAGEQPVLENSERLETPSETSWWKTTEASQPTIPKEESSLDPPSMAGEAPVLENNERLETPSESSWWKTTEASQPTIPKEDSSLDPPSMAGESPVLENNERLETPSESSWWKTTEASQPTIPKEESSLDPPSMAGESPVLENNERLETPSESSWWKTTEASQPTIPKEESSLDPPSMAGESPVLENNERLETPSESSWWKTTEASPPTAMPKEKNSLDPPTMAGEAPVLENNERLETPSTAPEAWWKVNETPVTESSLDPPSSSRTSPTTESETTAPSEAEPWWKTSSATKEDSLDPAPQNAGESPVVAKDQLMEESTSEGKENSEWWKVRDTTPKEPSLDPTAQAGQAPVLENDTILNDKDAPSSSPWWKVTTTPSADEPLERKEAVASNDAETQPNEGMKTPWWKGTPKEEAPTALKTTTTTTKPPLTMSYSSSAATVSEHILKSCPSETQASGAGGASTWDAFQRVEENWRRLRFGFDEPPRNFVTDDAAVGSCSPACWERLRLSNSRAKPLDYDILVCGGTLGIFFATALAMKGHRVGVVEAGKLQGRAQEWNISQNELDELVEMGILSKEDIEAAIKTDFPACRSGFKNEEETPLEGGYFSNGIGYECVTPDVLNLGVSPSILLDRVKKRFEKLGGVVYESTRLQGIALSSAVGVALDVGEDKEPITAQLVLDCMGNASPISKQQRQGKKPDGVCAVVGSCAAGFDASSNTLGDIIYTFNPIQDKGTNGQLQYFWEAFPVGIGRNGVAPGKSDVKTTYMFTYMDANEQRPSLLSLMEDYWNLLPTYQPSIQNPVTDLDVKRVLFAYFPTYTDSPLKPQWDRILAVGDASGIQSPLSFGGFGALTRHLDRITTAVDEAMEHQLLDKENLGAINAYTPNLSAAWMFQKAMSVRMGQKVDDKFVNRLLAVNFEVMDGMGQRTIKPFLQDVIRFDGLVGSLARSFVADPTYMPTIVAHVGIPRLVDWLGHVTMMGTYDLLHKAATPIVRPVVNNALKDPAQKYRWRRRMESWKFGSGNDYTLPEEEEEDDGGSSNQDFYDDEQDQKVETPKTYAPFS